MSCERRGTEVSVKEAHSSRRPRAGVLGWTCSAVDSSSPEKRLLSALRWGCRWAAPAAGFNQGATRVRGN